jgi:hypothetical protein
VRRALFREAPTVALLSGEENSLPDEVGSRLSMGVVADSWAELLAKTKPSFTWHDGDLLWIESNGRGEPQFTLDEAHLYQPPGARARWVLFDEEKCARFDPTWGLDSMGLCLRLVATLKAKRPEKRDGGFLVEGEDGHEIDGYAVVLDRHPRAGTVYEVGWERQMANGVAHPVELRKIYLLRDPGGRWQFLGEGCSDYCDRENESEAHARVEWVETKSGPIPEVRFVTTDDDHGHFTNEDNVSADWRDVVMHEEHVLAAPFPAQLRETTTHPYLVAEFGDTFDKIVEHLIEHQHGWMHDDSPEPEKTAAREMCRAVLCRLNPGLPAGVLATGTKVQVLSYGELVDEVAWRSGRR